MHPGVGGHRRLGFQARILGEGTRGEWWGPAWGSGGCGPPGPLRRQSVERRWPVGVGPPGPEPRWQGRQAAGAKARPGWFPTTAWGDAPPGPRGGSDSAARAPSWGHGCLQRLEASTRRVRRTNTPQAKDLKGTHGAREGRRLPTWRRGQGRGGRVRAGVRVSRAADGRARPGLRGGAEQRERVLPVKRDEAPHLVESERRRSPSGFRGQQRGTRRRSIVPLVGRALRPCPSGRRPRGPFWRHAAFARGEALPPHQGALRSSRGSGAVRAAFAPVGRRTGDSRDLRSDGRPTGPLRGRHRGPLRAGPLGSCPRGSPRGDVRRRGRARAAGLAECASAAPLRAKAFVSRRAFKPRPRGPRSFRPLEAPQGLQVSSGPAMAPGVAEAGPGRAARGLSSSPGGWGGGHAAGRLRADAAASSESTDAPGPTDLGGGGGQLGLLLPSSPPVVEGLGPGGDSGAQWRRPSASARACGRDGRDWKQAGTQRGGQWGRRALREAAEEAALGAA